MTLCRCVGKLKVLFYILRNIPSYNEISTESTTSHHLISDRIFTFFSQLSSIIFSYNIINSYFFHSVCIDWQLCILIASASNNLTSLAFPFSLPELSPGDKPSSSQFPTLKSNYLQPSTFNQIIFYQIYKRNFSTEIDCEGCKYFNLIF